MKFGMTSLDLHYLLKELDGLIGAKVDKIYHPNKKELLLQFYSRDLGKKILRIVVPDFMYLTEVKHEQPQTPSGFCTFLRKRLDNARLKHVNQLGFERIVELVFEAKEENYRFVFEMFSKGNMVLCKEDYTIISPLEIQHWSQRTVKPRVKYEYPKKDVNLLELGEEKFASLLKSKKKSVVRTLAVDLGLGGIYAEELCLRAKLDKNKKELDAKEITMLYKQISKMLDSSSNPRVYFVDGKAVGVTPIELEQSKGLKSKVFESYNLALDSVLTEQLEKSVKKEVLSKHEQRLEKMKLIVKKQEEHVKKLEQDIEDNNKKAEIIYNNYKTIEQILKELNEISKKHSWKEIREKLKGHKVVKEINPKEKTVVVELN
ncbi:NFACT family protein [Candidatus Woesearchaeota archaeon]|nr:NFACT family protein [Candidatus Woesearchaeota archaeon]